MTGSVDWAGRGHHPEGDRRFSPLAMVGSRILSQYHAATVSPLESMQGVEFFFFTWKLLSINLQDTTPFLLRPRSSSSLSFLGGSERDDFTMGHG